MSWINNLVNRYRMRNIPYNSSVAISRGNIVKFMSTFDTVVDPLFNFTSEISSLTIYPFRVKVYAPNMINYLKTTMWSRRDVEAFDISWYAWYQTLGQYYVRYKYGNFLDYKGYTTLKAFLPYLGYVDIDINECLGKYLQFRLLTDFNSGKGLYIIGVSDSPINHPNAPYVYDNEDDDIRVISVFECDIGIEIPLGQSNASDIKRNIILGTVKAVASFGFSAYAAAIPPPEKVTTFETSTSGYARGDYKGAKMKQVSQNTKIGEVRTTESKVVNKSLPYSEAFNSAVSTLSRSIPHGNTDRVNDSMLMFQASKNIHLVFYRPKVVEQGEDFNELYGKPLGEVKKLSSLFGYTEVSKIFFEGQGFNNATSYEIALIEKAFSEGVIL